MMKGNSNDSTSKSFLDCTFLYFATKANYTNPEHAKRIKQEYKKNCGQVPEFVRAFETAEIIDAAVKPKP